MKKIVEYWPQIYYSLIILILGIVLYHIQFQPKFITKENIMKLPDKGIAIIDLNLNNEKIYTKEQWSVWHEPFLKLMKNPKKLDQLQNFLIIIIDDYHLLRAKFLAYYLSKKYHIKTYIYDDSE